MSGHSSDESDSEDGGSTRYVRIKPSWRPDEITRLHELVDGYGDSGRTPKPGKRRIPGAKRRVRVDKGKFNPDAYAPTGMPENCYRKEWLKTLRLHELHTLNMPDFTYDFENGYETDDEALQDEQGAGIEERENMMDV